MLEGHVGLGALFVVDRPIEGGWNGWGWGGEGGWFASHAHPVALGNDEACLHRRGRVDDAHAQRHGPTDGLATLVLGVLLVLDAGGTITCASRTWGPLIVGALGAVLLASGLEAAARDGG